MARATYARACREKQLASAGLSGHNVKRVARANEMAVRRSDVMKLHVKRRSRGRPGRAADAGKGYGTGTWRRRTPQAYRRDWFCLNFTKSSVMSYGWRALMPPERASSHVASVQAECVRPYVYVSMLL